MIDPRPLSAVPPSEQALSVVALAAVLQDESADGDTRFGAAEGLGRIVGRRFDKQTDPIAAALSWISAHPVDAES